MPVLFKFAQFAWNKLISAKKTSSSDGMLDGEKKSVWYFVTQYEENKEFVRTSECVRASVR